MRGWADPIAWNWHAGAQISLCEPCDPRPLAGPIIDEQLGLAIEMRPVATVIVFTAFDTAGALIFDLLRRRCAIYNELVREVAERHRVVVVDFWSSSKYRDNRMWDRDRLHLSSARRQNMAIRLLEQLGIAQVRAQSIQVSNPMLIPHNAVGRICCGSRILRCRGSSVGIGSPAFR